MENRPSHSELRSELARRGLPQAYVERLVAELDDHLSDLLEERNSSMGAARKLQFDADEVLGDVSSDASAIAAARLGEPVQLAIFAAEQYQARSFWGRHPWLTFAALPLPLLVACFFGYGLAFWGVTYTIDLIGEYVFDLSESNMGTPADYLLLQALFLALVSWYAIVMPPLTSAWLLCRTYRRNSLNKRWPVLGCVLLAVWCAVFQTSYRLAVEPNTGQLMFGFELGYSLEYLLRYLPKFALALVIGLLLVKRAQRQMELQS
jgi:hypothetical protein